MAGVTGIGGVFLNISGDKEKLWYHEVLGLDITEYSISFLVSNQFTIPTSITRIWEDGWLRRKSTISRRSGL